MQDDCGPTTFNLAVPATPPTCVGNGGTTFGDFIGQLVDHGFAGAWRFSPGHVKIDAGSSLQIVNRGGETHTFTQVTQFGGGGIVPSTLTPGTHLFFCAIHPWMEETVVVTNG
jgi:hypothetical protein